MRSSLGIINSNSCSLTSSISEKKRLFMRNVNEKFSKKRKGVGKQEILNNLERIKAKVLTGYTIVSIYEELKDEEIISIGLRAFEKHIKSIDLKNKFNQQSQSQTKPSTSSYSAPPKQINSKTRTHH